MKVMTTDKLSLIFAALADPTRRAMLARLRMGEMTVGELAEPFDMSLPAISKHLKVLERAGLIERRREAQWRLTRLDAEPLRNVDDWLDNYRRFWSESFDRLDDYLRELQAEQRSHESPHKHTGKNAGKETDANSDEEQQNLQENPGEEQ